MCPPMWEHWRHLANTIEPSVCGGDAVLCQITLTICYILISTNCSIMCTHLRSGKTEVTSHPRTLSVDKFHDARFNCSSVTDVEEIHLLKITWSHDGRPISNGSRHHVTQTMTSRGGYGHLRIYSVRGPDNGRYECTASNGLDTAVSDPAYLLVKGFSR